MARGRAEIKDKQWAWSTLVLGVQEEETQVGAAAATVSSVTLLERSRLPVTGATAPQ